MKRSLALACLFASPLAFATATTTVTSGNTFGVLRVDVGTKADQVIIAIPWLEASTGDADISVTNVIKTANLYSGDQLYYYNTTTRKYQVWKLNDSKTWDAAKVVDDTDDGTESAVDGQTLTRGNAILLKRPGTKSESIYLYGQVPSTSTCVVTMAQGTSTAPAYTLIAPPAVGETDLNKNATWSDVATGDAIILDDGTLLVYTTINGSKKWAEKTGYSDDTNTNTYSTDSAKISAGQGAWYMSAKGASSAAKVTWTGLPSTSN